MAEAARSVRHYVSDCLVERHPYDVRKGFAGQPARDAGKAFDGHVFAGGVDNLVNTLADVSVSDEEHARAARYLYSHSSSQERKIELIEKGIVPILVATLNGTTSDMLRHQCFLLLWSLCVLPQGCYPVLQCGGIDAALQAALEPKRTEGDVASHSQVRAAAANVITQASSNPAGLRWLLRAESCDEFILQGVEYPPAAVQQEASSLAVAPTPETLMSGLAAIVGQEASVESRVALNCATALAHLTSLAPGIRQITEATAGPLASLLPSLVHQHMEYVSLLTAASDVMSPPLTYLAQTLTTVWNVAMDQSGVELLDKCGAPDALFALFAVVHSRGVAAVPSAVQRALLGALSAVSKLASVKLRSTEPLNCEGDSNTLQGNTRVLALLQYLRDVNDHVDKAKASGKEPAKDLVAVSKNTVQCIRLASEVRAVRDFTHSYLDKLDTDATSNEGFYVRRQLYCSTKWEGEFHASV